jgi:hypothetical protein
LAKYLGNLHFSRWAIIITLFLITGDTIFAQKNPGRTNFEGPPPPPANWKPPKGIANTTSPTDLSYLVPGIKLVPEKKPVYTPKNYYIERTIDSSFSDSAGFAILPRDYRIQPIRFEGTKSKLFHKYFESVAVKNKSLLPLTLVLKRYQIEEKQLNKADLEISLALCFDVYCRVDSQLYLVQHMGDTLQAEGYVGSKRKYDSLLKVHIRQFLEITDEFAGPFKEFVESAENTQALVQLATPKDENEEADTLYIDDKRYLQWSDFRGKPEQKGIAFGNYGIYLTANIIPQDNKVVAAITIYPVLIRNSSWADEDARSGRLLNHINYELLLTYSHALQLKKKLHNQTYPANKMNEQISLLLDQEIELLNNEREKYSRETQSGENARAQAEWEEKIGNDLKHYSKDQ